jgi:hypothetical protein
VEFWLRTIDFLGADAGDREKYATQLHLFCEERIKEMERDPEEHRAVSDLAVFKYVAKKLGSGLAYRGDTNTTAVNSAATG